MEENNSNRLDLQNNYPSISPSQFSDTFKINKQYNDIQMNNINKINNNININSFNDEEMNAMKNEFEEQKKKISSLCKLIDKDGIISYANIEYNQLDSLFKEKYNFRR